MAHPENIYELITRLMRSTSKLIAGESYKNVYLTGALSNLRFEEEVRTARFRDFFRSIVTKCDDDGIHLNPIEHFNAAIWTLERRYAADESNPAGLLIMLIKSFYKQAVRDNLPHVSMKN